MEESKARSKPSFGSRIKRSWRLTNIAWDLMRRDRTMLSLAALSLISAAAAMALIFGLGGIFGGGSYSSTRFIIVAAIAAYPTTFVSIFFNVALASAAVAAMDGRHLSVGEAIGEARARAGRIALWTLITATVGVVLNQLAQRLPAGARIASGLLGAAWGLATIFVVPVLVLEQAGAVEAVKRSAHLMKSKWGEALSGTITIGFWTVVITLPAVFVFLIGFSVLPSAPVVGAVFLALAVLMISTAAALSTALRQVFAVALYRYVADGTATVFPAEELERPFFGKRG